MDNKLTTVTFPENVDFVSSYSFQNNKITSAHFLGDRPKVLSYSTFFDNPLATITYCSQKDGWPGEPLGDLNDAITPISDCDGDGVGDLSDAFPNDGAETLDADGDGVGDNSDAFPGIALDGRTDSDSDGYPDDCDDSCVRVGMISDSDDDNDGVEDSNDAFPLDGSESMDTDGDGLGNNADIDDDNDGFTDEEELAVGTNPLSRFSCKSGCFSFDVDESLQAQPLTDGLLVIRHLFGFSGDALTSGAVASDANRDASEVIASYLTDADSQLDIDGDGESKPLTDGLLLIRYLFGFSGDSLVSGAIGFDATRNTAEAVEAYIKERVPSD